MDKVLAAFSHTVTDETLLLKWISFSPAGINRLLTLLLSLSHVEKPLLSLYWSPKNQVSLSPIVFTIYTQDTDNMIWTTSICRNTDDAVTLDIPGQRAVCQWCWAGWQTPSQHPQLLLEHLSARGKKTDAEIQEETFCSVSAGQA